MGETKYIRIKKNVSVIVLSVVKMFKRNAISREFFRTNRNVTSFTAFKIMSPNLGELGEGLTTPHCKKAACCLTLHSAGICEDGNGTSGSTKGGEFRD
jgi:hypothetical protein